MTALGAPPDDDNGPLGGWVMAAATRKGKIVLFDERQRRETAVIRNHKAWVTDLYFTPVSMDEEALA